jgi:hypothetical protein
MLSCTGGLNTKIVATEVGKEQKKKIQKKEEGSPHLGHDPVQQIVTASSGGGAVLHCKAGKLHHGIGAGSKFGAPVKDGTAVDTQTVNIVHHMGPRLDGVRSV